MASELGAVREFWELRADPVYQGRGVPHGSGRQVLVVPGLFGTDFYLNPMRTWLRRIGYTPRMSTLPINAGCPQRLIDRIENSLASISSSEPLAVIGHSRGGMLGKVIAARLGARCSHFIALGSPVGALWRMGPEAMSDASAMQTIASTQVAEAGRRAMQFIDPDCTFPDCECAYLGALSAPLHDDTKVSSIYSTDDAVVSPKACPIDGAVNIEVRGTHSGLVFNKQVFPHIAAALSD